MEDINKKILEVEKDLNIIIPNVYKEILLKNLNRNFEDCMLYDINEIKEFYKSCEFSTYMPNYIPIGGDYGEFIFVIKSGANEVEFGIIDEGAIGSSTVENLQNFNEWYINGHNLSDLL